MKRIIFFSILFCNTIFSITGQVVNLNPDANGTPWLTGGVPKMTPVYQQKINSIPMMVRKSFIEPPSRVDNSENKFMPPIFIQTHGCCAQASGVGYVFTYEISLLRDLPADSIIYKENQYPTHFTYNFLNGGNPLQGSTVENGWDIIKENGCPTVQIYGSMDANGNPTHWMTGYEDYYSAMQNRIDYYETIDLSDPDSALINIKQWLYNRNDNNAEFGSLVSFVTNMQACDIEIIQPPHPEFGKTFLNEYLEPDPEDQNHQLTIVGFDDNIELWDINGDGYYTNDIDVDSNGCIDLFDYEKGAFKVANSWGTTWPNTASKGYIYWPYRFLAYGPDTTLPDPFIGSKAFILYPLVNCEPELLLKVNLYHERRRIIRFDVDFGENANDNSPEINKYYDAFSMNGGNYPLLGHQNYDPLEVVLDYSQFFSEEDVGKLFFNVWQGLNTDTLGYLSHFSLVDYRWGETFELDSDITHETIEFMFNWFSIDYDLIVPGDDQVISQNTNLSSNMVCRFSPTVTENTTLTIKNGVEIDMYNSELIIDEGSELIIEDSVVFRSKKGNSKIIINGAVNSVLNEITFEADPGCTLEIILNNESATVSFTDCSFENVLLTSYAYSLSISNNSSLTNSFIDHTNGYFNLANSNLNSSSVKLFNTGETTAAISVSLTGNTFNQGYTMTNEIISINGYANFVFDNNTVINQIMTVGTYFGLAVFNSGGNFRNEHSISGNEIYSQESCMDSRCPSIPIGIVIYNSYAKLENNYVHHNYLGIECLNSPQVTIIGNSSANNEEQTQRFINNGSYQIFVSEYGFPALIEWNAIYDNVYSSTCFIKHAVDMNNNPPDVVVENNYWGTNFNPTVNLCPDADHFDYTPIWSFGSKSSSIQSDAAELFNTGLEQEADSNYVAAKSIFQEVVTVYPETIFANTAMKELLYLEPLAGNDYAGLKTWYLTEQVILENSQLLKLGQSLANKCDEKMENYGIAIDWYEDMIDDPPTLQDSIFAIIDLENVYLQMGIDTNLRSDYIGSMPQYKPVSFLAHQVHRNELLSLLLSNDQLLGVSNGEFVNNDESEKISGLLQNKPNPFSGKTTLLFKLNWKDIFSAKIKVYSHTGEILKELKMGSPKTGLNRIEVDMVDYSAGLYFYSLFINGKHVDTKKMVLIK